LRTFELNYLFDLTGTNALDNLRIFIRGENVAQIINKAFTGPDPENPNNAYGRPRQLTLGVNITL
jgi:hypothetical protein